MSRFWNRKSLMAKGLILLAVALVPVLAAITALAFNSVALARIDKHLPVDRETRLAQAQLVKGLVDAETGVRGYLLTKEKRFLEPYERTVVEAPALLDAIEEHEVDADHEAPSNTIRILAERQLTMLGGFMDNGASIGALNEAKRVMDAFRTKMDAIQAQEDSEIAVLVRERDELRRQQLLLLLGGIGIGTLSGGVAGMIMLKGIIGRIRTTTRNATLLAEGKRLEPSAGGSDELGQMELRLHETARLLAEREQAMREAKEEAERANNSKSEFLSRMSHELRTPLNAILGFAQLARTEVNESSAADLDQILKAGRHLLALIDEVLDISRIEAGNMSVSLEAISVAEVVRESMDLVRPLAADEGITIDVDGAALTTAAVRADRQRLKQVLLNLLSNAIKYNVHGGRVSFDVTQDTDEVTVSVADTGVGMSASAQERLFTPFDRLGAENSTVQGTGLGLALSRRLIEVMDGRLEVDSEPGKGTTFRLTLPSTELPIDSLQEPISISQRENAESEAECSILYIDDNVSNVKLVERILAKNFGCRLVSAMQGRIGLDLAAKHRPDLVMLDLHLPDMDGEEVLQRLRGQESTRHIPVMIVSADAVPSHIARLKEMGADAYVTKPFEIATLVDEIRGALNMQRRAA